MNRAGLPLPDLLRHLYVDLKLSTEQISNVVMAERGIYMEPGNVNYRLKRIGVELRSRAEAKALMRGKSQGGKLHAESNLYGPVPHRPAVLPEQRPGWPTPQQLMSGNARIAGR